MIHINVIAANNYRDILYRHPVQASSRRYPLSYVPRSELILDLFTCMGMYNRVCGCRKTKTTSGYRTRKATPTGRRVLKARRKKGRKVLCPASVRKDGKNRI